MIRVVRPAIEEKLNAGVSRKNHKELYVSDLGRHPLAVMRRIVDGESTEFDVSTKEIMQFGNLFEDDTAEALRFTYPGVLTQFPLYDEHWSGYADFVLGHLSSSEPVQIIEHKATDSKWFDYKQSLPRASHVCQLWLYGWLYAKRFGTDPYLILYYRSWKNYAEFTLFSHPSGVLAKGVVNGDPVERIVPVYPPALRRELEELFRNGVVPDDDMGIAPDDWDYAIKASVRYSGDRWPRGFLWDDLV